MRRRSALTRLCAVLAAALAASAGFAQAQTAPASKQVTVRVGYNPLAGGLPIVGTMMTDKLFEKEATKLGYQVTTEWIPFLAGAPPANAAMLSGRLDIDVDFGVAAIVPRIKNKIPIVVFGIHASHLSNAIVVRPGSDIDDVSKLAGKTIGLPLATSAHYTLATVVQEGTGKSLQELGVKLVNMTPSEGIKMPAGLDAAAQSCIARHTAIVLSAKPSQRRGGDKYVGRRDSSAAPAWETRFPNSAAHAPGLRRVRTPRQS